MNLQFNTDVFKPRWYKEQMSGWSKQSYFLLTFGIAFLIGIALGAPTITNISIFTLIAGSIGFMTTLAITNARPINGLLGLISAIIYIGLAIHAKNPADAIMQGVYVILLDIPVLVIPGWAKDVQKKVRAISETPNAARWYLVTLAVFVIAWLVLYWFDTTGLTMLHALPSPRPLVDATTAAIGVTGAALTTLRFSNSYYFWIAQGIAQVILWGLTASQGDASIALMMTYMLYLANDAIAIFYSPWFKKGLRK